MIFNNNKLKPVLFSVMHNYNKDKAIKDITAGVLVGIIAIPLSIALAIASGATPEAGLWTAALAGFVVAVLGGSAVQVSGPTGAFVVIVYGIIQQYGYQGLIVATLMAGLLMIMLGLCQAGSLVKFIPYPITIGFTTGIAVTLFTGQLGDFFGFQIANLPANFIGKLIAYGQNIGTISIYTTIIGLGSLLLIVVWNRYNRYIPGSLVALVVATLFVKFGQWPVQTIGGRFGELSAAFPTMQIPVLDFAMVRGLVGPALSIAILGSIESLLSAVVADGMTGRRHNSNMELVAQGTGNLVSALFGGLPVTGAIARTAANVRSGGRTPIAGMVHAVTVLVCTLVFMPMVKHVPMTTLAAILFTVCYNMVEWRSIKELLRAPKSDINVLLATFLFTVIFDLVVAIEVGLALAVLLFMKRMIEVTDVIDISDSVNYNQPDDCQLPVELADKVMVYRIQGPFFFGAANSFLNVEKQLNREIRAIIFCMEEAQAMDATGLHALLVFLHTCRKMKIEVFIVGAKEQPMRAMAKGRILEMVNDKHIYQTKEEAFAYIVSVQQHMINIEKYTHRWHHLHESPSDHNKKS